MTQLAEVDARRLYLGQGYTSLFAWCTGALLARQGHLSPDEFKMCLQRLDQDQELLVLRDLTLDLCGSNLLPAIATPRSLDLAYLRTALGFHASAPLTGFITLDQVQAEAARELGLPIPESR